MRCMETTIHHSTMEESLVRGKRRKIRSLLSLLSRTIMICLAGRHYLGRTGAYAFSQFHPRSSYRLITLFSSLESEFKAASPLAEPQDVAIVGGGLAGLATAFHLLQKAPDTKITIFDKALPGCGGASSVAGG